MNKQQRLALLDYVVVYGNEKSILIDEPSVKMTLVDDKQVTIEYRNISLKTTSSLNILWENTPDGEGIVVSSASDIKGKLDAMAKYAAAKQGFATKRIDRLDPPSKLACTWYLVFVIMAVNAYNPVFMRQMLQKDIAFQMFAQFFPLALKSIYLIYELHARSIFLVMVSVHVLEILFISIPFMKKYRTPKAQQCAWVAMHFVQGYPLYRRLSALGD